MGENEIRIEENANLRKVELWKPITQFLYKFRLRILFFGTPRYAGCRGESIASLETHENQSGNQCLLEKVSEV